MSKECPNCRDDNADYATVCENCGCAFTGGETRIARSVLLMKDLKSGKAITINGDCTIGRSGNIETDFFAEDMYISEYHCKVTLENSEFKIEHLPTAKNPTKLNNIILSKGIRNVMRNGDYLTIADKMFEISLTSDTAAADETTPCDEGKQEAAVSEEIIPAAPPRYIITCPKCGEVYEVPDINERIKECKNCDEYDKNEIAKIGARVKYAN